MLKIITSMKELDFSQLVAVYEESIHKSGMENYSDLSENVRYLQAEQDLYSYFKLFFKQKDSVCAVWAPEGIYKAALRLEPYSDGLLLAGLETSPESRNRGMAKSLLGAVVDKLGCGGQILVYSHVDKRNSASLAVHDSCGFERIKEYAVYSDGSVFHGICTFCKRI